MTNDSISSLEIPGSRVWSELGVRLGDELHAGHQSRVFRAQGPTGPLVMKLTDQGQADAAFGQRLEFLWRLAEVNGAVVGPVELAGDPVVSVAGWFIVAYPFVDGAPAETDDQNTAIEVAKTLARLHESMASLDGFALPPVAALRSAGFEGLGDRRIVHGDFAATNLVVTPTGIRVIDFDDCGYGTVEFEIGNSLYMELFDAWHEGERARYDRFRTAFVNAYREASNVSIDDVILDRAIQVRVDALGRWLDDPIDAPIGIRTASADWQRYLRRFVEAVA